MKRNKERGEQELDRQSEVDGEGKERQTRAKKKDKEQQIYFSLPCQIDE